MVIMNLPYPPTLNTYWRHVGNKVLISKKGRQYRKTIGDYVLVGRLPKFEGRIGCSILVYPPDKRKRDLDNIPKAVLDSLQHAGVYDDDSQIDVLEV